MKTVTPLAKVQLHPAADGGATIGAAGADCFGAAALNRGGAGHTAGFDNKSDAAADDRSADRAKDFQSGAAVQLGSAGIAAGVDN